MRIRYLGSVLVFDLGLLLMATDRLDRCCCTGVNERDAAFTCKFALVALVHVSYPDRCPGRTGAWQ